MGVPRQNQLRTTDLNDTMVATSVTWDSGYHFGIKQCSLVVTYCKDNLQVVQHVNVFRKAFTGPTDQVVLTGGGGAGKGLTGHVL